MPFTITPAVPQALPKVGYQRRHEWCQRCVRNLDGKTHSIKAVVTRGCQKATNSRCDRCVAGKRQCHDVPISYYSAVDNLVDAAINYHASGPAISGWTKEKIHKRASDIGKKIQQSKKKAKTAVASDTGITDATGQLILHALRTLVEVTAAAARIELPDWPENLQSSESFGSDSDESVDDE